MGKKNLKEWLDWILLLHKKEMDFDLRRIAIVANRLGLTKPSCPVITVGGTNGKGSCVAGLEAIYQAAGYKVGAFTSPILFKHNEYVRLQGIEVADELFCHAFEKIDAVRDSIPLTFFEFNTLAAFDIFTAANLDVWILEVGLGGRLDAVNIMDADLAIITSIAIDHAEWLGETRELIAREKAGIFRPEKPAICGDFEPTILPMIANNLKTPLYLQGKDFQFQTNGENWSWHYLETHYHNIKKPKLALQNMATVLMGVTLLQSTLPVGAQAIYHGIETVDLPGRLQVEEGDVTTIFDVSHNPAAALFLVNFLKTMPTPGRLLAVFSMLKDKDIFATVVTMKDYCEHWYIAPLQTERGASLEKLLENFALAEVTDVSAYDSVRVGYEKAMQEAKKGDVVVVFGSFRTVAEVLGDRSH